MKSRVFSVIVILAAIFISNYTMAQGIAVNTTGLAPDSSAILDLNSNSMGFLLPRMTTAERNAIVSPAEGLQVFNTDTKCFEFYVNSVWLTLGCGCTSPSAAGAISGSDTVVAGQSAVAYSVSDIAGATTYVWSYSGSGVLILGSGKNITLDFSDSATSGILSVYGSNSCGSGAISNYDISVYVVKKFLSVGLHSWIIPSGVSSVRVLVVAGGGGGGASHAGGGGGGGMVYYTNYATSPGDTIDIQIGAGGAGACNTCEKTIKGGNGGNSKFDTIVAVGGGGGGNRRDDGIPGLEFGALGGSGGGGGGLDPGPISGGAGISLQGNAGGYSYTGGAEAAGGGGGGAGSAGIDASYSHGGDGGNGRGCAISGQTEYYAGGGGGGAYTWPQGIGGVGVHGGGTGAYVNIPSTAGTTNTGGGGGGGGAADHGPNNRAGADGGSGIVIVSYKNN